MGSNKVLVLGGCGFIGHHLARRLKKQGAWVRVADIKQYEYGKPNFADEVIYGDLRESDFCSRVMFVEDGFDEVYQMAADMGGAQFVFTGEHDADIMHNSAQINLNVCDLAVKLGVKKLFYSSSACMYPAYNQDEPDNPNCMESSAYPAAPDSEYGWEKLFSERLYLAYARNHGLNVRIARFHNIYGVEGTYDGGREKAPAAMCRKVALAKDGGEIEVWGDGKQTRSFLYIDECVEGVLRLMKSDFKEPINIGSDEMVSINDLAQMAIDISGKDLTIKNIPSNALGVRGRNSDNNLIAEKLSWHPVYPLEKGLQKTYKWINQQLK